MHKTFDFMILILARFFFSDVCLRRVSGTGVQKVSRWEDKIYRFKKNGYSKKRNNAGRGWWLGKVCLFRDCNVSAAMEAAVVEVRFLIASKPKRDSR